MTDRSLQKRIQLTIAGANAWPWRLGATNPHLAFSNCRFFSSQFITISYHRYADSAFLT